MPTLEANRASAEPRQKVIAAKPALQERELAKLEALADALAGELRSRGVPDPQGALAARAGMAAIAHAPIGWLDDPTAGLGERLDQSFAALQSVLSGAAPPRR